MIRLNKLSLLAVIGALALAFAFAGCGQDNTNTTDNNPQQSENTDNADQGGKTTPTQSTGGGKSVALAADPSGALKFDKTSLTADAGNVTIDFTNDSSTPHNVTVEASGDKELGKTDDITKSSAKLDLKDLKPGKYTFYCSVPGHKDAGMEGTLTVN